ncbi:uncharacterized protein Z519_06809 [Cladophialophora bantiana CBS 173.52]|uniref:Uncharacterized protein n=1 Tax=Cladophialophora bantiana (strain ATCC 10958 / CBS 173.52 / CDC B-1940 / NIH 8579) TaxID=1442370 RepID=A0A0D2HQ51_CLAB1|nr:uncharacterized protein Z519_06809 [Cladophialophora bantiana CBS 173.52]KIW92960.1 hypothetical protein Z519_06809 [Cladophialophora bantiana CBS 173.52]
MFTSNPISVGVIPLPNGVAQILFGGIATLFMSKSAILKLQVIVLLVFQMVFTTAYAGVVPSDRAGFVVFQYLGTGPFAMITLPCYAVAGLNVPLRHLGIASRLIGTFQSDGESVGNAVFNMIINAVVKSEIPKKIAEVTTAYSLSSTQLAALIPVTALNAVGVPVAFATAAASAYKQAYAFAFKRVFYSFIPFRVIAIICALFTKGPSQYLTDYLVVHTVRAGALGKTPYLQNSGLKMKRT